MKMGLNRYEIRNEYGYGDGEMYKKVDKDDPEALLEGVSMSALVGLLRQLGDLAQFAAEIFHDLHEEVMATAARGHSMIVRVQQLEAEFPSVEKTLLLQTSHTAFLYNSGIDRRPNLRMDENLVTRGDLPRFVLDSYEECRGPPRLFLLDKFDVAGAGACLKRYTDPSFFKEASSSTGGNSEGKREKRTRKSKKRGPRWRNGDNTPETYPSSHAKLHQLFLEERIETGTTSKDPERRVKLKNRQFTGSPFDRDQRKSYMEIFLNTCSVQEETVDEKYVDFLPLTWPSENGCDSDSDILEIGTVSPLKESIHTDKNASPLHDDMYGFSEGKSKEFIASEAVGDTGCSCESNAGKISSTIPRISIGKECTDAESQSEIDVDNGQISDGFTSEIDNYLDALATIDSEVETDSECKKKPQYNNLKPSVIDSDKSDEKRRLQHYDAQLVANLITSEDDTNFFEGQDSSSCSVSVDTLAETTLNIDNISVVHHSNHAEISGNETEKHAFSDTRLTNPFISDLEHSEIVDHIGITSNLDLCFPSTEDLNSTPCFSFQEKISETINFGDARQPDDASGAIPSYLEDHIIREEVSLSLSEIADSDETNIPGVVSGGGKSNIELLSGCVEEVVKYDASPVENNLDCHHDLAKVEITATSNDGFKQDDENFHHDNVILSYSSLYPETVQESAKETLVFPVNDMLNGHKQAKLQVENLGHPAYSQGFPILGMLSNEPQINVNAPPLPPLPPMQWRLSKFQNSSATTALSEISSQDKEYGVREDNLAFTTSIDVRSHNGTLISTDGYVAEQGALTLPMLQNTSMDVAPTTALEVASHVNMNGIRSVDNMSFSTPSTSVMSHSRTQDPSNVYVGLSENDMNGIRSEDNMLSTSVSTIYPNGNQLSEESHEPCGNPCESGSSVDGHSSDHIVLFEVGPQDEQLGHFSKDTKEVNADFGHFAQDTKEVNSDFQFPITKIEPSPALVTPEAGRTWSNTYDGVQTNEDGNASGALQKKPPRPRNPLIDEVVAVDKSKLRKVERVKSAVELKPGDSELEQMQLKKVDRVKPLVEGNTEDGESRLDHVQLRKAKERVIPDIEQKPEETDSPRVQLRKVNKRAHPLLASKSLDRDSLLEQIRTKSFNLKPTVSTKPNIQGPSVQGARTNLKVAAILAKASNIRQAMAGSDEEDDGDNWSDC